MKSHVIGKGKLKIPQKFENMGDDHGKSVGKSRTGEIRGLGRTGTIRQCAAAAPLQLWRAARGEERFCSLEQNSRTKARNGSVAASRAVTKEQVFNI